MSTFSQWECHCPATSQFTDEVLVQSVHLTGRKMKSRDVKRTAEPGLQFQIQVTSHVTFLPSSGNREINTDAFQRRLASTRDGIPCGILLTVTDDWVKIRLDSGGRESNHNSATSFLCTFHKRPLPETLRSSSVNGLSGVVINRGLDHLDLNPVSPTHWLTGYPVTPQIVLLICTDIK